MNKRKTIKLYFDKILKAVDLNTSRILLVLTIVFILYIIKELPFISLVLDNSSTLFLICFFLIFIFFRIGFKIVFIGIFISLILLYVILLLNPANILAELLGNVLYGLMLILFLKFISEI